MVMGIRYLLFGAKLLIALAVRRCRLTGRLSLLGVYFWKYLPRLCQIQMVYHLCRYYGIKRLILIILICFKTTSTSSPRSLVARTTVGFASGHWTVLTNITGGVEEYSIQKSSGWKFFSECERTSLIDQWFYSALFRQSLLFSSTPCPEINAVLNRDCFNYFGKARVVNPVNSANICKVLRYSNI